MSATLNQAVTKGVRMRYLTRDGIIVQGATSGAVIDDLRAHSRTPGRDRSEYVEILAQGARLQTGVHVRSTDCNVLLADLVTAGLIEKLDSDV
jgi:hypothetical protein